MTGISRRTLVQAAGAGACALCVGACSGQPAKSNRGTPPSAVAESTSSSPTPIAAVSDLKGGPVSTVDPVTGKEAFLVETSGAVSMLSAVCTHAGCIVEWSASASHFVCLCHRGTYDLDGSVISGPPPKPLPAIPVRVEAGQIYREA